MYRLTDDLAIVQTIDFFPPVVDDPFIYGQIAAANALSDVYAMGAAPRTALNLVGYPDDKESLDWLGEILRGGAERCQASGTVIVGGHTVRDAEIKFGLAVTGVIHPQHIITNATARPGDKLVLTKALGTGFITTAHRSGACPEEVFQTACASMIQLNDIGRDAGAQPLARRPYLTRASATNASYVADQLRIEEKPESNRLEFFYDPQTSGGLLISVPADKAEDLVTDAKNRGASAACIIGEVIERDQHALILKP